MNKHSVQDLRHRAEFFKAESLKDIAEAMPLMMTGNPASAPLMRSAGAQAIMAGMCDEMADEIEAHAETRKRLLKLQWRHSGQRWPAIAQVPELAVYVRDFESPNNIRSALREAARWREVLHRNGGGVPR